MLQSVPFPLALLETERYLDSPAIHVIDQRIAAGKTPEDIKILLSPIRSLSHRRLEMQIYQRIALFISMDTLLIDEQEILPQSGAEYW